MKYIFCKTAGFHAQQCVEKSLACPEEYTKTVPRIHELDRLFSEAGKHMDIENDEIIVNKLNMLYILGFNKINLGFSAGWVEKLNPTNSECWVSLRSTQPTPK